MIHPLNIPVLTTLLYLYDVSADGQRFLVAGAVHRSRGSRNTLSGRYRESRPVAQVPEVPARPLDVVTASV